MKTFDALFAGGAEGAQFLLRGIGIVQGQMADEVALVAEGFATLGTLVTLLAGRRRHVVGIVVEVLVAAQQLLLPETLVALVALVWLLVRVDQHVRLEVTLRYGCVGAQVTLETLLSLVRFAMQLCNKTRKKYNHYQVISSRIWISIVSDLKCNERSNLECVAVGEGFSAALALERFIGSVQLLHVNAQIRFSAARRRAQFALEHRLVTRVDQLVSLCISLIFRSPLIDFTK